MTDKPIALVCGFGRCGSSLVMQMLARSKMPMTGQWPDFEDDNSSNPYWLQKQRGRAVKILDVHRAERFIPSGDYRTIWLDRDPHQQAKSQLKMLRELNGIKTGARHLRAFRKSLVNDRPKAMEKLATQGPVMALDFEQIINEPEMAALKIALFVGLDSHTAPIKAMAAVVFPRPTHAQPDMRLEAALLEEQEKERSDG